MPASKIRVPQPLMINLTRSPLTAEEDLGWMQMTPWDKPPFSQGNKKSLLRGCLGCADGEVNRFYGNLYISHKANLQPLESSLLGVNLPIWAASSVWAVPRDSSRSYAPGIVPCSDLASQQLPEPLEGL